MSNEQCFGTALGRVACKDTSETRDTIIIPRLSSAEALSLNMEQLNTYTHHSHIQHFNLVGTSSLQRGRAHRVVANC
jgi:hypothetical protein